MTQVSLQQVQEAVDFIELRLREEFSLDDVADTVGMSRFTLHRMFRATVGESLKGYIRKRRLTEAAKRLKASELGILELSMDAGFQSQEAFTRAFQGFFGLTPGQYRRESSRCYQPGLFRASPSSLVHHVSGLSLTPRIIEHLEPLNLCGWGVGADFEDEGPILALWQRLMGTFAEHGEMPPTFYGAVQASHPAIPLMEDQCLAYLAGVPSDAWPAHAEVPLELIVPTGLYAVFTHQGPLEHMIDTVNYAWATWLPQSGYEKSTRPDLELVPSWAFFEEAPQVELWLSIDTPSRPSL